MSCATVMDDEIRGKVFQSKDSFETVVDLLVFFFAVCDFGLVFASGFLFAAVAFVFVGFSSATEDFDFGLAFEADFLACVGSAFLLGVFLLGVAFFSAGCCIDCYTDPTPSCSGKHSLFLPEILLIFRHLHSSWS